MIIVIVLTLIGLAIVARSPGEKRYVAGHEDPAVFAPRKAASLLE